MSKQEEILHKLSTDDRNYIKEKIKQLKETIIGLEEELDCKRNYINELEIINNSQRKAMVRLIIQELRQVQEECFTQKELISTGQVAFFMVDIVDIMEIISQHIKELERV